jgi:hypothetical protein
MNALVPTSSSSSSAECVKVCVRVRPLLGYETTIRSAKIVQYPAPNSVALLNGSSAPQTFTFDYVFDDYSRQLEVYDQVVGPLVKSFMEGYNATILAYGQTGSGKVVCSLSLYDEHELTSFVCLLFQVKLTLWAPLSPVAHLKRRLE